MADLGRSVLLIVAGVFGVADENFAATIAADAGAIDSGTNTTDTKIMESASTTTAPLATTAHSMTLIYLAVGCGIAGIIVLTAVIVIVIVCQRRRKKQASIKQPSIKQPTTSIRSERGPIANVEPAVAPVAPTVERNASISLAPREDSRRSRMSIRSRSERGPPVPDQYQPAHYFADKVKTDAKRQYTKLKVKEPSG